ncbi:MAG: zinc ribbon domain-containing protein [Planctomycetota bacterium]
MKQVLARLVQLQRLDERRATLKRRLDSLPVELGERKSQQAVLEAAAEARAAERKSSLARAEELELEVREHELRIQKLEAQTRESRDAGAVQIAQHEVRQHRDKISKNEDEALALLERANALIAEVEKDRQKAREMAAELEKFARTVAEDQTALQAELDALGRERDVLEESLPFEARGVYDKLYPVRKGRPVAPLKGDSCGGCGMVVPPNDRMKVSARKALTRCPSCTRILVSADLWSPEAAGAEAAGE